MATLKQPAEVATTEDLGLTFPEFSGEIDGVVLKLGDRVLVKDQLKSTENGYYELVTEVPPTLMATDGTIDAEDVICVSQGRSNAHSAWSPIDPTNRIFVRQDVKNYSFDSIAALKQFWQAAPGAIASVAGYHERGDKGGGDFTFLGVPDQAKVVSAEPFDIAISNVTEVDGLITIAASGHGLGAANNVTTTCISGVTGLPDKAYSVTVVDEDTFTINAKISGVNLAAGASIRYVQLVTAAKHGRSSDQRISISGVENTDGAFDIRGVTDLCGVIDDRILSIPVATSGGKYKPGLNAVIGDDGLTVPATDPTGVYGGLWQRSQADHIDVKWYGAIADWDPIVGRGTDNLLAFNAAVAAMAGSGNKNKKVIANGHFYLSDTLHFHRSIVFEGAGWSAPTVGGTRSAPGTWLVFPRDVNGIQLHSAILNEGRLLEPQGGADYTTLRNLTIWCKHPRALLEVEVDGKKHLLPPPADDGQTGNGVWINCSYVCLDHVDVENFGEHGILIDAGHGGHPGNAGGFQLTKCIVGGCGGNGIHIRGSDATVGLVSGCTSGTNFGWGFFDETPAGTTYLACHGEGNLHFIGGVLVEQDYKTDSVSSPSNSSLYLNCYTESGINEVAGAALVIGGPLSQASYNPTPGKACMIAPGGALSGNPLYYANTSGPDATLIEFGCVPVGAGGVDGVVLNFSTPDLDAAYNNLRWDSLTGWWGIHNAHPNGRVSIRFPTIRTAPRRVAPLFENGIFFGSASKLNDPGTSKALVNHTAASATPPDGTWEKGDAVWNTKATPGGNIGWVCTTAGTNGKAPDGLTTGSIAAGDTTLTVSNEAVTELLRWQYIRIKKGADEYVPGTYQIVKITLPTIVIAPKARKSAPSGAAIAGDMVLGVMTARPVSVDDTIVTLNKLDGLVPGQNITIKNSENELDTYQIVKTTPPTIDIDVPVSGGALPGAAITFSEATFATFGTIEGTGQSVLNLGGGDHTLSLAEAAAPTIVATNSTVAIAITLPTPSDHAHAYQRTFRNLLTADGTLTVKLAAGASVAIAVGKTAIVGFDASGAYRVTADV